MIACNARVISLRNWYLLLVLILVCVCVDSWARDREENLEILAQRVVESVKNRNTTKVIQYMGDVNLSLLRKARIALETNTALDRFTGPISDAAAVLGGEGVLLIDVKKLIDTESAAFNKSYQFDTLTPKDYRLVTEELENMDTNTLVSEYARVSSEATSDINAYNQQITAAENHKDDLNQLMNELINAEQQARELADMLENLNSSGLSALLMGQPSLVWLELKLYIEDSLALRTEAIRKSVERIESRVENLREVRDEAILIRQNVDFFWWYEVFRNGVSTKNNAPGAAELEQAKAVETAGAEAKIDAIRSHAIARSAETAAVVRQLEAEANNLDAREARIAQIRRLTGIASAAVSVGSLTSPQNGTAQSAPASSNESSLPIIFEPMEVKDILPQPKNPPPSPPPVEIPQSIPGQLPDSTGPLILGSTGM